MNGNIQNSSETLKSHLRTINYGKIPTFNDFTAYNPAIFLQIIHHMLIDYSPTVYEYIVQKDYELFSKNDYRFMECVYKFLIQEFNMKPSINLKQFFTDGFLESKLNLCISVVTAIKNLEAKIASEKKPPKSKNPSKSKSTEGSNKETIKPGKGTLIYVVNHYDEPLLDNSKNQFEEIPRPIENVRENSNKNVPYLMKMEDDDSNFEDITPLSQLHIKPESMLPVKPEAAHDFDLIENKENDRRYYNQQQDMKRSSSDNYPIKPSGENKDNQPVSNKPDQTREILKMIVEMNSAFMTLTKKFEGFQTNVEGWMKNVNAQLLLLETNFKILKSQVAVKNKTENE